MAVLDWTLKLFQAGGVTDQRHSLLSKKYILGGGGGWRGWEGGKRVRVLAVISVECVGVVCMKIAAYLP